MAYVMVLLLMLGFVVKVVVVVGGGDPVVGGGGMEGGADIWIWMDVKEGWCTGVRDPWMCERMQHMRSDWM